jgi:hypothetical protein
MRADISEGTIGAPAQRRPWRSRKPARPRHAGIAARISGHIRNGDDRTNAGAESHGLDSQRDCCAFGRKPGPGADASTSALTRSGLAAA